MAKRTEPGQRSSGSVSSKGELDVGTAQRLATQLRRWTCPINGDQDREKSQSTDRGSAP